MCGIAGILNLNGYSSGVLKPLMRMSRKMWSRGPDDEGFLIVANNGDVDSLSENSRCREELKLKTCEDYEERNTLLGFAHRRLSIIDISCNGHQPFSTDNRRYWIVFNGEIYNFKQIKKDLLSLGYTFKTNSDTEVLIKSYQQWKENCLDYFNGDFAFAIWDNKEKYLFCARDRLGIKPFYYVLINNQFIFASDIKTIISSGLYQPQVNPEGLYFAMAFGIAPRPITAFKNIFSLEQGSYLKIYPDAKMIKNRYWSIPVGISDKRLSLHDSVDMLDEALHQSIQLRLNADVEVGTFMSGGIDSTTISAIASRYHSGIKAFTLTFKEKFHDYDEIEQAKASAKINPLEHIIFEVDQDKILSNIYEYIYGYEEPFYHLAVNSVLAKRVSEENIKVVLNGLGGDELFAGYSYYSYAQWWTFINRIPSNLKKLLPYAGKKGKRVYQAATAKTADRLHTILFQHIHDEQLKNLFTAPELMDINTADRIHKLYAQDIDFENPVEAMSYMDIMNYIGNHHVHRVDQFTMAHSIEGRFPFLDHKLIETAFKIPSQWKLYHGEKKYVLRQVAKKYIHSSSLEMKKRGFGLPLEHWMKGTLSTLVKSKIESLMRRSIVSPETVQSWYQGYLLGSVPASHIWHLVALELWFELFFDNIINE